MRFLVDVQIPIRLTQWLVDQGHEAQHALDIGLGRSGDNAIWRRAIEIAAVIVTKDEDFAEWVKRGRVGPRVVWLRTGNGTTAQLTAILTPLLPRLIDRLNDGERLIEVRRSG